MKTYLLATLLAFGFSASAGSERGNGADTIEFDHGAAWYVIRDQNFRTVQACFDMSPGFGVSPDKVKNAIVDGYAKWKDYLAKKKVQGANGDGIKWNNATEVNVAAGCKGGEDLRFKFGVMDREVLDAVAKTQQPVSVAVRTSFDRDKAWGSGFIWLAAHGSIPDRFGRTYPDWTRPDDFEGIVLHELGHVFGNSHLKGTIMDEHIAQALGTRPNNGGYHNMKYIDGRRELAICSSCDINYEGYLGGDDAEKGHFEKLTGREPVGSIRAAVKIESGVRHLLVADSVGNYDFELTPKKGKFWNSIDVGIPLFKIITDHAGVWHSTAAYTEELTLTSKTGQKHSVRMNRNINGYVFNVANRPRGTQQVNPERLNLVLVGDDEATTLFGFDGL